MKTKQPEKKLLKLNKEALKSLSSPDLDEIRGGKLYRPEASSSASWAS
jgi:hypothetical protein